MSNTFKSDDDISQNTTANFYASRKLVLHQQSRRLDPYTLCLFNSSILGRKLLWNDPVGRGEKNKTKQDCSIYRRALDGNEVLYFV